MPPAAATSPPDRSAPLPAPTLPPTAPQYGALTDTLQRLGYQPKGIIHAGAHFGEQMDRYLSLRPARIVWIESDPRSAETLRGKVAALRDAPTEQVVIQALITDRDGETRPFYRFSNAANPRACFAQPSCYAKPGQAWTRRGRCCGSPPPA